MLTIGALLQILAHVLRTWMPPFPLYAVTFLLASLGQAFNDTHANTFVSSQRGAHRWLGFIHAMYMAGCLAGPFVATAVASANADSQWNLFYIFPLGLGVINLAFVALSFHDRMAVGKKRREESSEVGSTGKNALKEIKATLSTPGVWLLSLFFFFFLGAAITAGGKYSSEASDHCFLREETNISRMDGRIPCQSPQRRRQRHGICACRLLRRRIPWPTDSCRANASLWRTTHDLHIRGAMCWTTAGILAVSTVRFEFRISHTNESPESQISLLKL